MYRQESLIKTQKRFSFCVDATRSISWWGMLQHLYQSLCPSSAFCKGSTFCSQPLFTLGTFSHVNVIVKPICKIFSECRIDSVNAVHHQTKNDAVIILAESEEEDAGILHEALALTCQLTEFKFLVSIVVWYNILFQVNVVSESMQNKKNLHIVAATNLINACHYYIVNYREVEYKGVLRTAKEIVENLVDLVFQPAPCICRKRM